MPCGKIITQVNNSSSERNFCKEQIQFDFRFDKDRLDILVVSENKTEDAFPTERFSKKVTESLWTGSILHPRLYVLVFGGIFL